MVSVSVCCVSQAVGPGRGENMTEVRLRLSVMANRCLARSYRPIRCRVAQPHRSTATAAVNRAMAQHSFTDPIVTRLADAVMSILTGESPESSHSWHLFELALCD